VAAPSSRGPNGWQRWLHVLTLNELTAVAAVVLWLWFLILLAGQLRRDWARILRLYRNVVGIGTVLMLAWLGMVLQMRLGSSAAVVVAREAVIHYGPFEEAQRFYTAKDGTEMAVLDRKDNWFQVSDDSKRIGWLQAKDILLLPRG
jgi:hypothetical protein